VLAAEMDASIIIDPLRMSQLLEGLQAKALL